MSSGSHRVTTAKVAAAAGVSYVAVIDGQDIYGSSYHLLTAFCS